MGDRNDEVATLLEFFGIKLTTGNEQLAAFLKIDISDLVQHELKQLFRKVHSEISTSPPLDEELKGRS